ncbi:PAS domain-containing protein [Hymenobacter gummosus]|uniref:histidine kinase n=1 Tax=Hymenobacter gummosus TaxID=1776032 RepID=A0A3S0JF17_9BACT|nr:PAS domain-containing protein [Hymenobacter gummosus]RTQ47532.1 PAS domain-containing protein [Hymenobacter gummosus]
MPARPTLSDAPGFPDSIYTAALDLSLAAIVYYTPVIDAAGEVTDFAFAYLNPAAQQLLRLPARPATTFAQQFPQALSNGTFAFHRDAYLSGEPRELRTAHRADDQEFIIQLAAWRVADGLLVSFTALGNVASSAVEQALRQSEEQELAAYGEALRQRERLYRILDQAPAMICVFDGPEHVFQFVNPAYQALVGPRRLLGLPIAQAMPELHGQPIFGLLDRVYQTGETFYANEMLVQLDHQNEGRRALAELEKRYYNFIYQARRNHLGRIDGIVVFAYDVTPQVQARQLVQRQNDELEARVAERTRALEEARLRAEQQRQQLDQLFMQAPAAICVLDGPALVYQLVNPSYQQAFPGRPLLGRPLLEALPELHDSPIPGILAEVYATGEPYQAQELPLRAARVDGGPLEQMYWTFTYQARRDNEGRVDGVLVFAYDVTEQVAARQVVMANQQQTQALADELSAANARLTRINADLDTFVYTASHDLKAPITNIEGLLQALRQQLALPPAEADTEQVLGLMQDSVQRFQRTIKYLTDITQWQHVQDQPATPVPLAPLVEDVRLDLAPLLAVSGGQVMLDENSCDTIIFAEKNLRSLVYNLISNALKYRAPDRVPLVQVRCHTDAAGAAVLEVQDNGLGLTEAQRQRVFGMFQRLHRHVEGAGIGLFLVKQVVEKVGGRIEVESQPGAGSTFRAVLPQRLPSN